MPHTTTLVSAGDAYRPHRTFPRIPMLVRYLEGWATADPTIIADATADGYEFHDPLVGRFCEYSTA